MRSCYLDRRVNRTNGIAYFCIRHMPPCKTKPRAQWLGRYGTVATPEKIREACQKHGVKINGELIPRDPVREAEAIENLRRCYEALSAEDRARYESRIKRSQEMNRRAKH